jgi:peptide-methionine (S)-S-oxide reductase
MLVTSSPQTLVLGGGCFWCTEAVFKDVRGVTDVESGYSNGQFERPSYEAGLHRPHRLQRGRQAELRPDTDQHAGDPGDLLRDSRPHHAEPPGQRCRHAVPQRHLLHHARTESRGRRPDPRDEPGQLFGAPVVTEVLPLANYWPAEDYHQDFFEKNPYQGYCMAVAAPKVAKFRKTFSRLAKS